MNTMREIRIEKVTVNIGRGEPGDKVEQARKLLETLTGKKIITTKTEKRNTFGVSKGRHIGVKVTLRNEDAINFLNKAFEACERKIKASQFDTQGNFSFGVPEYIDMPGVEYDPDIGIIGMDVAVTLERPGFSISKRRIRPEKTGKAHRITKEEAMEFAKKTLNIAIE